MAQQRRHNQATRTSGAGPRLGDLEVRTVSMTDFEVRSSDTAAGIFEGYANRFSTLDDYGTRWKQGSWTKGGLDSDPYPLLWMHDPWNPIGTFRASEDTTGLEIEGKWDNSDEGKRGRDRYDSGSAVDLSVGFKTLAKDPKDKTFITSSLLREVSQLTTRWGSSPGARIASVRMTAGVDERRAIEGSYEDLQDELREALQAQFGGGAGNYLWVMATFPDRVIYCAGGMDADDNTWQVSYTEDEGAETFTFGTPVQVDVHQVVEPRSKADEGLEIRRRREAALLALNVPIVARR